MVLGQQRCHAQTYVAGTGYCYCYIFEIFHHYSGIFIFVFLKIKKIFEFLRLPLAKGSSTFLSKPLFNSLYAPFGSPSSGGQKPSGTRGCNRPPVLRTATL